MSSDIDTTTDASALASGLHTTLILHLAGSFLVFYDMALTMPEEIAYIWKRKYTMGSFLYFIARYGTLAQVCVMLAAYFSPELSSSAHRGVCANMAVFEGVSSLFLTSIYQVIMALRVYALWNMSSKVLLGLFVCWALQLCTCAVAYSTGFLWSIPHPLVGCILTGEGLIWKIQIFGVMLPDGAIFLCTLWRTRKKWTFGEFGHQPIIHILRRDGFIYFLIIFCLNIINAMVYMFAAPSFKAVTLCISQMIQAVLVCRLMHNIRSTNSGDSKPKALTSTATAASSTLRSIVSADKPSFLNFAPIKDAIDSISGDFREDESVVHMQRGGEAEDFDMVIMISPASLK